MRCGKPIVPRGPGFALVTTVALLVLLSLLAIALLSLTTITVRATSSDVLEAEARQNARLALSLAIGELQKLAGPDQRVTARAEVLDNTPSIHGDKTVAQPNWTGVWKSWKWNGSGPAPDYPHEKEAGFLGWLASHPYPANLQDLDAATSEQAHVDEFIFHDGTAAGRTDVSDIVRGRNVRLQTTGRHAGLYSWVVFDEGQKARFRLPDQDPQSTSERIAALSAPSTLSFEDLPRLKPLDHLDNETRDKLVSLRQLDLVKVKEARSYFHDISPYSSTLLTDVVNGGFAHDLSLLFNNRRLPNSHSRRHLYSNRNAPLAPAPTRFLGANPMPSPDPSWRLLHSHYNLYRSVRDASGRPVIDATFLTRPPAGTDPAHAANHPSFHDQNIAPVIAKAQFVFSMSAGWHPHLNKLRNVGAATAEDKYISWLVTDPIITLWNPYNVALRFREARIDLYRIPLSFRLYRNGRKINDEFTHFANTFLGGDLSHRRNRYYRLNIKPEAGTNDVILNPGEFKVFTAHNHVKHYRHAYSEQGVDLLPGFNAPAGNASNPHVGGISTLNMCIGSRGLPSGAINGSPVRTVPLRPGDRLQIEVKPQRADVDKFLEAGGKEITAFLRYTRPGETDGQVGGIELDYAGRESELLASYHRNDLSTFTVPDDIPFGVKADDYEGNRPPPLCRFKEPFLIASLQLKSEQDSVFPSKGWLQNSPTNLYSSAGLDQREDFATHQYEFAWEPMTDWTSSPTIEIDENNRGFGASGIYAQTGREFAPFHGVPLSPPVSLVEFRHAPLNQGGQIPLTSQVVGNSFANPLLERDRIRSRAQNRTFLDHSYLANNRLFDHHFLSTATTQDTALHPNYRPLEETLHDFLRGADRLPNPRFRPSARSLDDAGLLADDLNSREGYRRIGAYLTVDGGFNVNSTSVEAWRAFLSSVSMETLPLLDAITGKLRTLKGDGVIVSRFALPSQPDLDSAAGPDERDQLKWSGYRRLDSAQVNALAAAIVEQVKRRGPFQSVAEFVNRRVEDSRLGLNGALQAAIDQAGLNSGFADTGAVIRPRAGAYADSTAARGLTSEGAPAFINQADLLTPLAPFVSVRSDTFRIRAMGEASDKAGKTVCAVCEAVVQRVPEFIDPNDPPYTAPANLRTGGMNERFGRRFEIISFRWLTKAEL